MRENSVVPPGLESFLPHSPALPRWAKLVRPVGAGFSRISFVAWKRVQTRTLEGLRHPKSEFFWSRWSRALPFRVSPYSNWRTAAETCGWERSSRPCGPWPPCKAFMQRWKCVCVRT